MFYKKEIMFSKTKMTDQDQQELLHACRTGDLKKVQKTCKNKHLMEYLHMDKYLQEAIFGGQLEIIKYFLTTTDFDQKKEFDFSDKDHATYLFIGSYGYIDVIEFMLTPDMVDKYLDEANFESLFFGCCMAKTILPIRYMLTEQPTDYEVDINANDDRPIYYALKYGCMDTVKYLLKSDELIKHASLAPQSLEIVKVLSYPSHDTENLERLSYLINECQFKATPEINCYLDALENVNITKKIKQMFELAKIKETAEIPLNIKIKNML